MDWELFDYIWWNTIYPSTSWKLDGIYKRKSANLITKNNNWIKIFERVSFGYSQACLRGVIFSKTLLQLDNAVLNWISSWLQGKIVGVVGKKLLQNGRGRGLEYHLSQLLVICFFTEFGKYWVYSASTHRCKGKTKINIILPYANLTSIKNNITFFSE